MKNRVKRDAEVVDGGSALDESPQPADEQEFSAVPMVDGEGLSEESGIG